MTQVRLSKLVRSHPSLILDKKEVVNVTILGEVLQVVKYIFMIYLLSRAVINFAKAYQIIKKANQKG